MKAEWTRFAFVQDAAIPIDHVQPIRPARIRSLRRISEIVHQGGDLDVKVAHAALGDTASFVQAFRRSENYVVPDVRAHLPDIAGMRFLNVTDKGRNPVLGATVQPV